MGQKCHRREKEAGVFLSVIGEGLPLGYVNFQTLPRFLKKQAKGVQQPEGLLVSAEKMQELAPVGCRECGAVRSRPRPTSDQSSHSPAQSCPGVAFDQSSLA